MSQIVDCLKKIILQVDKWGDMLKSVYDPDADGVVADSDKLEGSTKTQVRDHTPKAHTLGSHSTKGHSELTGVTTSQHHIKTVKTTTLAEIAPDYDSEWVSVAFEAIHTFTHSLNSWDLLPVIYFRTAAGQSCSIWGCGTTVMGDAWLNTANSLQVYNGWANKQVRVLLWKF